MCSSDVLCDVAVTSVTVVCYVTVWPHISICMQHGDILNTAVAHTHSGAQPVSLMSAEGSSPGQRSRVIKLTSHHQGAMLGKGAAILLLTLALCLIKLGDYFHPTVTIPGNRHTARAE